MPRYPSKPELILLIINNHARPSELINIGYTKATAYNSTRRAKKVLEDYVIAKRKLRALRDQKMEENPMQKFEKVE